MWNVTIPEPGGARVRQLRDLLRVGRVADAAALADQILIDGEHV
jgi:hypothetical protein